MLKQGLFMDVNGTEYTVFEQVVDNFSRLDICKKDAQFHLGVDDVLFSIVHNRGTFILGDRDLYRAYNSLLEMAAQVHVQEEISHKWEYGKYYTTVVKSLPANGFLEESVQCNGNFDSYTLKCKGALLTTWVVSDYSTAKQVPMNFSDYEELALEKVDVTHVDAPFYPLSVLRARYNIEHLYECDFVVADTLELAEERLQRWLDMDVPYKGIDTETTGTDIDLYGKDKLVGVILSYKYGEATYFPFAHLKFDNLGEEFLQKKLMPAIKHEEGKLVAHNKKFERKVFLHQGWSIFIKYDTMPLSFMVNPVIQRGAHALKDLMFRATGKEFLELDKIFTSPKLINFAVLPKEIVRLYACPDASNVLFLLPWLWDQLPEYSRKITEVEFELADVKADQEYYGLRVDVEKFQKNLDNCDYTLTKLLEAFRAMTHIDGNINSNEVLSDLIFGQMQCPVLVRTKTGKPSTGAASIKKLASIKVDKEREVKVEQDICDKYGKPVVKAKDLNNAKYPALVILEKYRVYAKLRTAFYARFERTKKSGRVFFWVNQNGATTGRQSSPMHQLPGELKDIILSDSPEHDMWDPDYSQIELRMIAFLAGEKDLIELCKDPENDIHRAIGSLISNKPMWQISAEERKSGKRRNFGVVYLISAYGLAAQMFGAGYTKEQVQIAQKSLDDFYDRFKRIKKYIAMNGIRVQEQGKVSTFFGRTKYFKEIFDPELSSRKRASIIRQSNNVPVQGTAADLMKLAETNMNRYIRNKGWDTLMPNGFPRVRVALSIHDEILLMVDKSIPYEEILLLIRECMELPIEGAPPFFCAPALVSTWAQHDDDSVAMPVNLRDRLIRQYQESGVSQINHDNYIDVINAYREAELENYMQGLVKQYGNSADAITPHIQHPSLTHELIARYPAPKDLGLSHEEKIRYAAERYCEGYNPPVEEQDRASTKETPESVMEDFSELSKLVNFDSEGNPVYDAPEEDAVEEEISTVWDDERMIAELACCEKIYVWELMDTLIIDIEDLDEHQSNEVIKWVWQFRQDDGFFSVNFVKGGRLYNSGFRVEDIDKVELTNFIKEVVGSGSNVETR